MADGRSLWDLVFSLITKDNYHEMFENMAPLYRLCSRSGIFSHPNLYNHMIKYKMLAVLSQQIFVKVAVCPTWPSPEPARVPDPHIHLQLRLLRNHFQLLVSSSQLHFLRVGYFDAVGS